jgi:hypothetical protein
MTITFTTILAQRFVSRCERGMMSFGAMLADLFGFLKLGHWSLFEPALVQLG